MTFSDQNNISRSNLLTSWPYQCICWSGHDLAVPRSTEPDPCTELYIVRGHDKPIEPILNIVSDSNDMLQKLNFLSDIIDVIHVNKYE